MKKGKYDEKSTNMNLKRAKKEEKWRKEEKKEYNNIYDILFLRSSNPK